jgi:hypothetical protein
MSFLAVQLSNQVFNASLDKRIVSGSVLSAHTCTCWVKSSLHYPPCMPGLGVVESTSDADPRPVTNETTEYFDRILETPLVPPIYNERLALRVGSRPTKTCPFRLL